MGTPNVCIGCFSKWEKGKDVCPHCGWSPKRVYSEMFQWRTGDILETRYIVGEVFCRIKDIAVWRLYDNVLGIPCFVLRKMRDSKEELYSLALQLLSSDIFGAEEIAVLSIKRVAGKYVLVFTLKEWFIESEKMKYLLNSDIKNNAAVDRKEAVLPNVEREQALPAGTLLDERYQVKGCIGIGGFGITYLCEDLFLHRDVAVKEYFPEKWAERDKEYVAVKNVKVVDAYKFGLRSFLKEVCITAKFIHNPQIVTVYDAIEANDTAYMVMEYIPGISIGRELRAREYKPYTPKEMAEVICPVLSGLGEIHSQRIVHGDISPGNIMRSKQGKIYLIDLGAAKYNLESQPVLSAAFLKIDYAAPEQYQTAREGVPRGEGPWTDIYGVGATMYYMLTGHKPTDVITRLNQKNPDLAAPRKYKVRLSRKWMNLIHHAMELEREKRIRSISEFGDEIRRLLE